MTPRQQSSTSHPIPIRLVSSSDHVTPVTGATVTVTLAKDGATSFSAASGAVTEAGNGLYWFAGNATDRNTLGSCLLRATATGADDYDTEITIVPYDPFVGVGVDWAQTANVGATVNFTGTTIANLSHVLANALVSTSFSANCLTGAAVAGSFAAQIATGIWQDTTAGDFTVAGSIGKSLFTSGNAPGAASGLALVGSNMGTVSSVTGNVGGNVVGSVGSISGITFPTNFGVLGISAGGHIVTVDTTTTATTATNLTNAPTAGDFTAAMKTSLNAATPTATIAGADGLTFTSLQELLIAFVAGKATYVDNGDGTATLTFKKQDGTTTKYTVTFNKTTGARTASTIS